MRLRTATIVRYAVVGLAIGFMIACALVIVTRPLPPADVLIGQSIGAVLGATVVVGFIGYLVARRQPADARMPQISPARRIALGLCGAVLAAAVAGIAFLLSPRPAPAPVTASPMVAPPTSVFAPAPATSGQ